MQKTKEEELVSSNLPLIHFVIKKYALTPLPGDDYDDLAQIGSLGLLKAIKRYRGSEGAFSTFAATCIRNELFTYLKRGRHWRFQTSLSTVVARDSDTEEVVELEETQPSPLCVEEIVDARDKIRRAFQFDAPLTAGLIMGLSQKELAKKLKRSMTTISRRRRLLQEVLGDD